MALLMPLSGVILALSVLASVVTGLFGLTPAVAGLLQLTAGIILWGKVPAGVRRVSLLLLIGGIAARSFAPQMPSLTDALSKNQQMIAMLAAIGLLRYSPQPAVAEDSPQGARALWQTLFGLHWLASVINISALAIFSDRLAVNQRLTGFQGKMLTRGFSMAALWSPFFIAMGVALTSAPGADYRQLLLWGLPFSQLLLAAMVLQTIRKNPDEVSRFQGYSFHLSTLVAPAGLALGVIICHQLFPQISILTIITLLLPSYPLLASRERSAMSIVKQFVIDDLPRMGPEIVLFFSAGVLGSGLSALVAGRSFPLVVDLSPLLLICAGLAVIIAAASFGIHPVVGVTVVGGMVSGARLPVDLLALSFLFGWGLGVLVNPISGIHILLAGRYGYPSQKVWRWNLPFVGLAYLAACAWFWLYSVVTG